MPEDNRSRKGTPGSANPNECYTCLGPVDHWHHVVPYSMGGNITLPLCNECHSKVHDKDLLTMKKLSAAATKTAKMKGIRLARPSMYSNELIQRIEKMYKDNSTTTTIAKKLIADNTWPRPEKLEGKWVTNSKHYRYWLTPSAKWIRLCKQKVEDALKAGQYQRELAENKFWYELSLKPEGERCAWMPDYEPVTRGSNLPSLFTETLQPAFDLKTTATPGTWNLSQWAWNAEQDT